MENNSNKVYDVVVIGGGINGMGTALDAAGRGMRVCLVEKQDFAGATSSTSTKLIHGGLRYLEHFEFKMVKESLHERNCLLKNAPHLVHPLAFILPINPNIRSGLIIRIGLWLYDLFSGKQKIARSKKINLTKKSKHPLNLVIKNAYQYYDCYTDDARLVITLAKAAKQKGADIISYTNCTKASKLNDLWQLELTPKNGKPYNIKSKVIVNATGPWANIFVEKTLHSVSQYHLALIKGSHIIVQKMYEGKNAYVLQNADRRIVFVIPYVNHYTLIGTTDVEHENADPAKGEVSIVEKKYLIESVNNYFHKSLNLEDILWSFWGVRPLVKDKHNALSEITRDYKLEVIHDDGHYPVINIFGGKLTTFRSLGENVTNHLQQFLNNSKKAWTHDFLLPGGDLNTKTFDEFVTLLESQFSFLPEVMLLRLAQLYGSETYTILKDAKNIEDLGEYFGADLYEAEVKYLIENEWVMQVDDLLWRRTKLGLKLSKEQQQALAKKINTIHPLRCGAYNAKIFPHIST